MDEIESESTKFNEKYEDEPNVKRVFIIYYIIQYYSIRLIFLYLKKWTKYLIMCCLTVTICGSFSYGYNIGSLNSPTEVIYIF